MNDAEHERARHGLGYGSHHERATWRNARIRDVLWMWDWGGAKCWTCGRPAEMYACRDKRCRAIMRLYARGGIYRRHSMMGDAFPLWLIVGYLRSMCTQHGKLAQEFGKRFAHVKRNAANPGADAQ